MDALHRQAEKNIEIIHAILTMLALVMADAAAAGVLNKTPPTVAYYHVALGLTVLVFIAIPRLGSAAFIKDIFELCFYDVVLQLFGWYWFLAGHKPDLYMIFAEVIFMLKVLRLGWPILGTRFQLPAEWPPFGPFGFWQHYRSGPGFGSGISKQAKRMYDLLLTLVVMSAFLILFSRDKFDIPFLYMGILILIFYGTPKLIQSLTDRERATMEAMDIAATREMAVAAERLKNAAELAAAHAELHQKHTELQTLYDERATLTQRLAARNDRLNEATHELPHAMLPLAFMANTLLNHAQTDEQRLAVNELRTEIDDVTLQMVKVIRNAKFTHDLPPHPVMGKLAVRPLCDYFFERFNPLALEQEVTLKCKVRGKLSDIYTDEDNFKRLVSSLLGSGIGCAGRNTDAMLTFSRAANACHVHILVSGPGIANLTGPDRVANFANLLERAEKDAFTRQQAALGTPMQLPKSTAALLNAARLADTLGIGIGVRSKSGFGTGFRLKVPLLH